MADCDTKLSSKSYSRGVALLVLFLLLSFIFGMIVAFILDDWAMRRHYKRFLKEWEQRDPEAYKKWKEAQPKKKEPIRWLLLLKRKFGRKAKTSTAPEDIEMGRTNAAVETEGDNK